GQDNVVDDGVDEQPIHDIALNVDNVFQADDCDAFDYDDEASLSYDSDILSEVHDHDHYQDAVCEHYEVHEMHDDVQPNYVVDSHTGYTSDSNMIPYDQTIQMGTLRETLTEGAEGALHLGPEPPRVYFDLTSKEKDRYNTDIWATNILLQGLPKDIYSLISHYTDAKDIWDNVKMLMEGSELTKEDRGQDNVVDDDVDEQPIQDLVLNVDNMFQADDCDAFDSDVDEAPIAQTMFMANLSSIDLIYDEASPSYDSDVLSEVHDHDHYQDVVCEHHEVNEMHDNVQPKYVVNSHTA
nr:integrase, catalytic region, zinc finger, CCHC-type, peptidase aspartic, catalytic [Tanacetum cinerariifolium]